MMTSRETTQTHGRNTGPDSLQMILWRAIDDGTVNRKTLAAAMEGSEDAVARVMGGQMPKGHALRGLCTSRLLPIPLRDQILDWFLSPSNEHRAARRDTPVASELDANRDGRVDGRDAIVFEGKVLTAAGEALEVLFAAMVDGRLTETERTEARKRVEELERRVAFVRQVLDVEQRGGMKLVRA